MRPTDLPFTGWATGNYAAGADPWAGTSRRTAPADSFYTPNTEAKAQQDNYVIGSLWDATKGLLSHTGQLQALNWPISTNVTALASVTAGETGPFVICDLQHVLADPDGDSGTWYMTLLDTGDADKVYMVKSQDGGLNWTHVKDGANNHVATTGGVICAYGSDTIFVIEGSGTNWRKYVPSTNTWSNVAEPIATLDNVACIEFGGLLIVSNRNEKLATYNGSAWTDRSASFAASDGGGNFLAASSSVVVRVYNAGAKLYTSSDGVTWTSRTSPASGIEGLVWSPDHGVFVAITSTTVYTSPDGVTWTNVGSSFSNPGTLACSGALLLGCTKTDAQDYKFYHSVDKGVTWNRVPGFRVPTGVYGSHGASFRHNLSGNLDARLAEAKSSSGSVVQFGVWSAKYAYFSLKAGV